MEAVLLFFSGIIALAIGATFLIGATYELSIWYKISGFLSSFLFIGLATSSPEIFISVVTSFGEKSIIAVGNVIGSNIANVCLVFAIGVLLLPIGKVEDFDNALNTKVRIFKKFEVKELPTFFYYMSFLTAIAFLLLYDNEISRPDSLILIFLFLAPLFLIDNITEENINNSTEDEEKSLVPIFLKIIGGLIFLFVGTYLLLKGAQSIAVKIGIPDYVIGLSMTAIGTSLPELAAVIASIKKGHYEFIAGNIIGSNIFNIGLALGLAGSISPARISEAEWWVRDSIMMIIATIGAYIFMTQGGQPLSKIIGFFLFILFGFYQFKLYTV